MNKTDNTVTVNNDLGADNSLNVDSSSGVDTTEDQQKECRRQSKCRPWQQLWFSAQTLTASVGAEHPECRLLVKRLGGLLGHDRRLVEL
eukprot:scaffold244197_cov35-Prasinocladus_malaysianus.AAC.1